MKNHLLSSTAIARVPEEPKVQVAPTLFAYHELPDDWDEVGPIRDGMMEAQRAAGAVRSRLTFFDGMAPNQGDYPNGIYLEGWKEDPAKMRPRGEMAPFAFPMELAK